MHKLLCLSFLAVGLMGCAFLGELLEQQSPSLPSVPAPALQTPTANRAPGERWQPPLNLTWQWQLSGDFEPTIQADVYDLDLFESDAALLASLRAAGKHTICYLSAGSYEDWRPDAALFPPELIGAAYAGWPGEHWLDIR